MLDHDHIKDVAVDYVLSSIRRFAEGRRGRQAAFQVLDLIMPHERKIRSIVGGLETSFGTTLWEGLAIELAQQNNFEVCDKRNLLKPENFHEKTERIIRLVQNDREHERGEYNAETSHLAIKDACRGIEYEPDVFVSPPAGHGIDVWLKKDGIDYWFDIKTVHPNVGGYQRFLKQILNWYAYYYSRWPHGHLEARIVFPYNPHDRCFWDATPRGGLPLERGQEGWVADDFWDFCTGNKESTSCLFEGFKKIGEEGMVSEILKDLFA
jgi:hypothetical protein